TPQAKRVRSVPPPPTADEADPVDDDNAVEYEHDMTDEPYQARDNEAGNPDRPEDLDTGPTYEEPTIETDGGPLDDDDALLQDVAASGAHVSKKIRFQVRRAHRQLGHCSREALLRIARKGGASQDHLDYIKVYHCPICAERQAPLPRRAVSSRLRPSSFGAIVGIDTKEISD
ncbi:MAG: hypothetical protein NXI07_15240, partial [bacterium]|nr:hypothetical protein [bacterium]